MRGNRRGRTSIWFWVFVAVVLVILLGLLFGGYRKGTKVSSAPVPGHAVTSSVAAGP